MERHQKAEAFIRPKSLDDSLEILSYLRGSGQECLILAGGTDLLVKNRYSPFTGNNQIGTSTVVDITSVNELNEICVTSNGISIGALVTHAMLASSEKTGSD